MNRIFNCYKKCISPKNIRYKTVMSGIQPTGIPHIGNYLGAISQWIQLQSDQSIDRMFISIVDLHAMTPLIKPSDLKENVFQMTAALIACGLSSSKINLFQQSRITYHTYLTWLLMCICPLSRVQSMPQWREKLSALSNDESPNAALLMYPILQAADILLYSSHFVPVGDDQIIHLELARYLREKLVHWHHNESDSELANHLPVPEIMKCRFPKIYSLNTCLKKMSKSDPKEASRIELTDSPDEIKNKIMKSITDSLSGTITYDMKSRPGLANLINIYCAVKNSTPEVEILKIEKLSKVQFKELLIDELIEMIKPIRLKIIDLLNNRDEIDQVLKRGREKAYEKSTETINLIEHHVGLENILSNDIKLSSATNKVLN